MYIYLSDIFWEGRGHPMSTISIRDLQRNTSGVVAGVADSKHTALVTRHGEPIAALVPIDAQDLEDYLLSKVPSFAEDMAAADQAHANGETRSAADVFAELDVQDTGQ
jgi:prevent-host-death family protein